jgi:ABC-type Na+ efflux pump permease subunit
VSSSLPHNPFCARALSCLWLADRYTFIISQVATKIRAADESSKSALENTLGSDDTLKANINKELKAQGLAESTSVASTPAAAANDNVLDDAASSKSRLQIPLLVSIVVFLLHFIMA